MVSLIEIVPPYIEINECVNADNGVFPLYSNWHLSISTYASFSSSFEFPVNKINGDVAAVDKLSNFISYNPSFD